VPPRPAGLGGFGSLASLLLGHRPLRVCSLVAPRQQAKSPPAKPELIFAQTLSVAPAWEQAECYGRDLALESWRLWQTVQPKAAPAFAWHVEAVSLPLPKAHADFMATGGKEYGLTTETVGVLLAALCPATSHCTAVRVGDLTIVGVPGEMAAGLGLEVKAALRGRTGAKPVAIGGLADEWVSYMLTPDEYRKGGYEASVSFYGEDLGPRVVRTAIASATAVW